MFVVVVVVDSSFALRSEEEKRSLTQTTTTTTTRLVWLLSVVCVYLALVVCTKHSSLSLSYKRVMNEDGWMDCSC